MTDTLSIRDNRTGREYEVAITDNTIRAADLKQIVVDDGSGLATYDPGFVNTASCRSSITYIDGDVGILEYRGYPIEQLAEHPRFSRWYLLLHGELPPRPRRTNGSGITHHTFLHDNLKQFIRASATTPT
jgi:citrate synthase